MAIAFIQALLNKRDWYHQSTPNPDHGKTSNNNR